MLTEVANANLATNEIHLNKTGKNITLDARLTDEFGVSLSQALSVIVAGQMGLIPNQRRPSVHAKDLGSNPQLSLPGVTLPNDEQQDETVEGEIEPQDSSSEINSSREKLREIFTYEGEAKDRLRLDVTDLKATGQLDYSKRLAYLFLYAHKLEGREFVSKSQLKEIVEQDAVYDPNFINWMNNSSDLRIEGEEIRLRRPGREIAEIHLQELENTDVQGSWKPDTKSRKPGKSSNTDDNAKEPTSKPTRRASTNGASKAIVELKGKWESLNLQINGFDLFNSRPVTDKLMFGLWAISKSVGNPDVIASSSKIIDFLYQNFGIRVSKGGPTDKSLQSDATSGKVVKDKGGYRLLEAGSKYIEQTCNLPKPAPAGAKKVTKSTK